MKAINLGMILVGKNRKQTEKIIEEIRKKYNPKQLHYHECVYYER